jgi:protein-tyrosine phosphatase
MYAIKSKLSLSVKIPVGLEHKDFYENSLRQSECSLISNEIYVSGYKYSIDYEFLKANKFTHIINCAGDSKRFKPRIYDDFEYLVLDIKDDPNFNIEKSVKEVIKFIEEANTSCPNRKILIHCFEGISRAPALLISYLMWKDNVDRETALKLVKERRPYVEINIGFMSQLDNLKNSLNYFGEEIM